MNYFNFLIKYSFTLILFSILVYPIPDVFSETNAEKALLLKEEANLLLSQNKLDEALKLYLDALDLDPNNAAVWNNIGIVYDLQNKDQLALESFERSLELEPNNGKVIENIGSFYRDREMYDEAIAYFDSALKKDPFLTTAMFEKGITLLDAGRYNDAFAVYNHMQEYFPNDFNTALLGVMVKGSDLSIELSPKLLTSEIVIDGSDSDWTISRDDATKFSFRSSTEPIVTITGDIRIQHSSDSLYVFARINDPYEIEDQFRSVVLQFDEDGDKIFELGDDMKGFERDGPDFSMLSNDYHMGPFKSTLTPTITIDPNFAKSSYSGWIEYVSPTDINFEAVIPFDDDDTYDLNLSRCQEFNINLVYSSGDFFYPDDKTAISGNVTINPLDPEDKVPGFFGGVIAGGFIKYVLEFDPCDVNFPQNNEVKNNVNQINEVNDKDIKIIEELVAGINNHDLDKVTNMFFSDSFIIFVDQFGEQSKWNGKYEIRSFLEGLYQDDIYLELVEKPEYTEERIDWRIKFSTTELKNEGKIANGILNVKIQQSQIVNLGVTYSINYEVTNNESQDKDVELELEKAVVEVTQPEATAEGGGCLIATAAYGSELAPQVQFLREVRDNTLLSTTYGTSFMTGFNSLYYSFSPAVSDLERESPVFREAVKLFITPMLSTLSIMILAEDGSEAEVLGLGISVIVLNLGMYIAAPTIVVWQIKKRI